MKKITIKLYIILLLITNWAMAQPPTPGKPQSVAMVLKGGTIHIGNGQVIQSGKILFENGKISAVGTDINIPAGAEIIDVTGKQVYPGLILPNSHLGLVEVDAVRSTVDFADVVEIQPNVRTLVAYNTDSEIIPTVRNNGILLSQATPSGGIISGSSSVMQHDAWNWEDAAYRTDEGIHLNWPEIIHQTPGGDEADYKKRIESRAKVINELDNVLNEALSYSKTGDPQVKNLKFEAMRGLFNGTKTLYIHANYGKEIIEGVKFGQSKTIKKIVAVEAEDAWMITDFLKENNIPVILNSLHRLPTRSGDDIDLPFRIPSILQKAGILVSLSYNGGSQEVSSSRNLPFLGGTAATYGLSKEEALAMLTSNTAKILGIDDKTGTLEKGKDANIVVSEGDILDMKTSIVTHAFIQGRKLVLDDKQKRLYKRFSDKYSK